jgi:hypothetical protein
MQSKTHALFALPGTYEICPILGQWGTTLNLRYKELTREGRRVIEGTEKECEAKKKELEDDNSLF